MKFAFSCRLKHSEDLRLVVYSLCCLFFHVVEYLHLFFWSLVRPGLRLTDFYCLILSRLLANMQLRLDTLSSSHNYFCGNTKIYCFCAQIDFFGLRASTLWEPESWYVLYHDGRLQDTFSKNISFDDPQNGGHFSCRKPVSHVGTSTVSDSEALIHLAYVQHMWQSKFVVILEGLTRWRIELCWKMQLAGKWLQMHFDMHVYLLEKVLLCSFDSKNFCKICTIFGPQNGGWKMDPKMVPEFDPQNGVQKWHPKGRPNILNKALISCRSFLNQKNIGPPFWVPFLDPILGVKFWHHFWVHFSTSILGSKNGAKFAKVFAVKAA